MISKVSNNFGISNSSQAFRAVDPTATTATDAQAPTTTPMSEGVSFSSTSTPTPTELAPKKSGDFNWLGVVGAAGLTGLGVLAGHTWGSARTLGIIENGLKEIPGAVKVLEDDVKLNNVGEVVELFAQQKERVSKAFTKLGESETSLTEAKALYNTLNEDYIRLSALKETTELEKLDLQKKLDDLKSEAPKSEVVKAPQPEVVNAPQPEVVNAPQPSAGSLDLSKISNHTLNGKAFQEDYNVGTFRDSKGICVYRKGFDGRKHVWVDTGTKSDQGYKIYDFGDKVPVVTNPPSVDPNLSATPVEVVKAPQPEVVNAPQPEVVNAPQPEVVNAPQPEVVNAPQPEVVNAPQPEVVQKKGFIEKVKDFLGIVDPDDWGDV
ncbi:MAG: hypothetical protein ACK5T0_07755 [Vampirovibrionales bacterium]